ncbi:hypothetical protein [Brevibacillus centrosporus]|uniref:hypothetical protein n=1 Tax=Brevibacillus centrosporus TaxID=54910 RepID=UPI003B015FD7
MEMSEWNKVTDINLNGCVIGMMYVFSEMQKAGGGSIMAGTSPYTTAKGALRVLSKSAAVDGGRRRDSVLSSAHPASLISVSRKILRMEPSIWRPTNLAL